MNNEVLPKVRADIDGKEWNEISGIRGSRAAYKAFGRNPGRYRVSSEALIRRVRRGDELYHINSVVDVNNLISVESGLSVGSYDLGKIHGAITLRKAENGEGYSGIWKDFLDMENMLVLVDDLNLPFGTIRIRKQGSNGGHNGLGNIQSVLGTENYARVRFGIGNEYTRGTQINFVLGEWTDEEKKTIDERLKVTSEIIPSFCLQGIDRTMNQYNNK